MIFSMFKLLPVQNLSVNLRFSKQRSTYEKILIYRSIGNGVVRLF